MQQYLTSKLTLAEIRCDDPQRDFLVHCFSSLLTGSCSSEALGTVITGQPLHSNLFQCAISSSVISQAFILRIGPGLFFDSLQYFVH